MRKNVLIALLIVSSVCLADSVQQGCVKTRGRMINGKHVPGQGLPGSIVSIKDRTAIGVKNSNGTFSFPVTDNQFRVDSVKKKDYVLLDADAASKTYTHTADTLFFVMETPEQLWEDRYSAERRFRDELTIKLKAREREIDSLLKINKISQEEYRQTIQKIYAEQGDNEKLIRDMAERYSTLDYDQMDEFYRRVSYYIEQCEFVKADSLLKSRGNLHAQCEANNQLEKRGQQMIKTAQYNKVELAKRCYSYFENFKMQYQNDSAAYYLEQRVQLDTTNAQWLDELANFLEKYLAQYDKALKYYQQSLALRKQLFGDSHPDVATSYNNIGSVYDSQGDYARALEYHQQSLAILKQVYGESHPDVATSYNNIGAICDAQGDYARALEYYQQSLAIRKQFFGESHPDVATSYNNIGSVYHYQGDYARALEYHQQSLTIRKQLLGKSHPDVATSYNNIGNTYYHQGDHAHALEYLQQALVIRKQFFGESHPDIATSFLNIGLVYAAMSNYARALEYYQQVLAIWKQNYGESHLDVANLYIIIGELYYNQGDVRVLEYFQQAITILKQIYGEFHPDVATLYNSIGSLYFIQGDYARALEYYQNALDIRKQVLGLEYPDTKDTQEKIEQTLQKLNDEK